MSATLSRLILSMAVIAGAPLVWVMVVIWLDHGHSDEYAFFMADVVGAAYFLGAWTWAWAGHVKWNQRRLALTAAAAGGSFLIGGGVFLSITGVLQPGFVDVEIGLLLGGMAIAAAWPALTAFAWRETTAERAARLRRMGVDTIACPTCGYNLTGLSEARCPECGSRFTLDQLVGTVVETRAERDGVV